MKYALALAFIATVFLSLKNPLGFIFPIAIAIIACRQRLTNLLGTFSLPVTFIGVGVSLGLMTEALAIIGNWGLSPEKKILLHPNIFVDLLMGFFYYSFIILTWFLLLRRYRFSKKAVFMISGLLGVLTEQSGAIIFGVVTNPTVGIPMAMIVVCIYAIFPTIAYLLSEKKFSETRVQPTYRHYLLAIFLIFLQWAIYGNVVHSFLIELFPKFV